MRCAGSPAPLTAQSIDALHGREREHFQPSDELAEALSFDMAHWWEATPDTYLQAVPKAKLVEAVTQAVDAKAGEPIAAMKKDAGFWNRALLLRRMSSRGDSRRSGRR
jgi:DNA mismatch repair protein MutH